MPGSATTADPGTFACLRRCPRDAELPAGCRSCRRAAGSGLHSVKPSAGHGSRRQKVKEMVDHSGWRVGVASAPVHHGEILQGVFTGDGGLTRGLVTLPCTIHATRATFIPAPGAEVTVTPDWKGKARRAAELAVRAVTPPGAEPHGRSSGPHR